MQTTLIPNLPYDTIQVGGIYEYSVLDTVIPVEVLQINEGKIFNKENSAFLSYKLKDLINNKEFKVGIETSLLETLSESTKPYIFQFFPPGTKIEGLRL